MPLRFRVQPDCTQTRLSASVCCLKVLPARSANPQAQSRPCGDIDLLGRLSRLETSEMPRVRLSEASASAFSFLVRRQARSFPPSSSPRSRRPLVQIQRDEFLRDQMMRRAHYNQPIPRELCEGLDQAVRHQYTRYKTLAARPER